VVDLFHDRAVQARVDAVSGAEGLAFDGLLATHPPHSFSIDAFGLFSTAPRAFPFNPLAVFIAPSARPAGVVAARSFDADLAGHQPATSTAR
jgi:hypothetical protein